jgi:hypothetical protein
MTRPETVKLMAVLGAAYPRQEVNEGTAKLYCELLADLPYNVAETVIKRMIATCKYFPTIAEIRHEAVEMCLDLPTATDAWAEIYSHQDGEPRSSNFVRGICGAFGGLWTFRHTDNVDMLRSQFFKQYAEERERAIREEQARPALVAVEHKELGDGRP